MPNFSAQTFLYMKTRLHDLALLLGKKIVSVLTQMRTSKKKLEITAPKRTKSAKKQERQIVHRETFAKLEKGQKLNLATEFFYMYTLTDET